MQHEPRVLSHQQCQTDNGKEEKLSAHTSIAPTVLSTNIIRERRNISEKKTKQTKKKGGLYKISADILRCVIGVVTGKQRSTNTVVWCSYRKSYFIVIELIIKKTPLLIKTLGEKKKTTRYWRWHFLVSHQSKAISLAD